MLTIPFEVTSCSWPRPVAQAAGRWTSEPDWDAPPMPHAPCPSWRMVKGSPCWTIDWREHFSRDLRTAAPHRGGEMKGFHVVFRLHVRRAGRLVFWDDDGSVIRRGGAVVHSDRGAHDLKRHELEVFEGEELEVAQWQHVGGWLWGARLAGELDGPRRALPETLAPYLAAVERRLRTPGGPPLKVYTSAASPLRCVVGVYSMILNGYAPSKVLLYGDYQWGEKARRLFAELLPFAEVVPTERVLAHVRSAGGPRLAQLASDYWYVMKTFVALLCPPEEFCLLDDDVFVLGPLDDALDAFARHDLVYAPDTEHGEEYLKVWGWLDAAGAGPLPTGGFNAGLYFMRNGTDPREVARHTLRVKPHYFMPHLWEQGYIATLFARRKTLRLPTERYNFSLFDGLPGGPLGYDYANNPCGFSSVHFGGLSEKPSDEATLHLLPHILGRGLGAAVDEGVAVDEEEAAAGPYVYAP